MTCATFWRQFSLLRAISIASAYAWMQKESVFGAEETIDGFLGKLVNERDDKRDDLHDVPTKLTLWLNKWRFEEVYVHYIHSWRKLQCQNERQILQLQSTTGWLLNRSNITSKKLLSIDAIVNWNLEFSAIVLSGWIMFDGVQYQSANFNKPQLNFIPKELRTI